MDSLLDYIYSLTDFSEEGWQALLPVLTPLAFKKGEFLLKAGAVCDSLFFVSRGYCRAFYETDGKEINTAFFFENDIAANITSFARNEPSAFAIQACEAVSVVRFDKQKLREASVGHPEIEVLGRKCLQHIAARQEQHAALYKLMNPQQRYAYLQRHSPEMLQRVPLSQLASYLGIARETLSRIRGRRR